jgi:hypothetical protein
VTTSQVLDRPTLDLFLVREENTEERVPLGNPNALPTLFKGLSQRDAHFARNTPLDKFAGLALQNPRRPETLVPGRLHLLSGLSAPRLTEIPTLCGHR